MGCDGGPHSAARVGTPAAAAAAAGEPSPRKKKTKRRKLVHRKPDASGGGAAEQPQQELHEGAAADTVPRPGSSARGDVTAVLPAGISPNPTGAATTGAAAVVEAAQEDLQQPEQSAGMDLVTPAGEAATVVAAPAAAPAAEPQSEPAAAAAAPTAAAAAALALPDAPSDVQCPICLDTLYQPVSGRATL